MESLQQDLRRDFGPWVVRQYPRWVRGGPGAPTLSVDIVERYLLPLMDTHPVLFVVLDCMRLDQWRAIAPLLGRFFDIEESCHYSILPTATPYARNALFSGLFPDQIAAKRPGWWDTSGDEGSLNTFEDQLLRDQLLRLTGRKVSRSLTRRCSPTGTRRRCGGGSSRR